MDIFAKAGSKGKKCSDCGGRLTPEGEAGLEGMASQAGWEAAYRFVFMTRRARYVCMNERCKSYFPKTHHKFIINLLGLPVDEHFIDDAMRKSRKK